MRNERDDDVAPEQVDDHGGGELPDRIAMSTIDANVAIPADPAIAASVLSDDPFGEADAETNDEAAGGRRRGRG